MNDRAFICDQIKIDRKYGLIGNTEILVFNEFTILLTHHISNTVEWRKPIGDEVIIFYIADKFESGSETTSCQTYSQIYLLQYCYWKS